MELVSVSPAIVSIGECMIEFSRAVAHGSVWKLHYGGDTLNSAVYMARLGQPVTYLTALGADPYSEQMCLEWAGEGIDTSHVLIKEDRLPGLYMIQTNEAGERSFHYWRQHSAARVLFDCAGADLAMRRAENAGLLYLTGITLSLFENPQRVRLAELCQKVRENGGQVAFDPNYRPRGWDSPQTAWTAFQAIARHADYVLPTLDDEALIHRDGSAEACLQRWISAGAREVAIKLGPEGALVADEGTLRQVATQKEVPRDTTGAGDGFNAAYLLARRHGHAPMQAAQFGNRLAGAIVRQPGAIIPRATMPLMSGLRSSQLGCAE